MKRNFPQQNQYFLICIQEMEPDFWGRASHGGGTEWSSIQWDTPWCSRAFAKGFALLSTDLSATPSSGPPPQPSGSGQGTRHPTWFTSQLLNHLLLSPTAALRCCCQADLPNAVLAGLYSNESKTGSSFQGCLYAKEGVKA